MTFTGSIPQTGQSLGQTRDNIRDNFTNYNDTMSVNHVPPNGAGGYPQGKHTFAEFVVQAQSPPTTTAEVALYSRSLGIPNGTPQLFLQKENQLVNTADIQMSRLDTGVLNAVNGWTFLPGGLIYQWGIFAFVGAASSVNVVFATSNISFPTNCWNVQLTGIGFNNTFDVTNTDNLHFTASRSLGTLGSNQSFYWTAIGK